MQMKCHKSMKRYFDAISSTFDLWILNMPHCPVYVFHVNWKGGRVQKNEWNFDPWCRWYNSPVLFLLHPSFGRKIWLIKNSIDITLFKAATRQPSVFKCEGPVRLHDKPFMSAISCSHSVISNDFDSKEYRKSDCWYLYFDKYGNFWHRKYKIRKDVGNS